MSHPVRQSELWTPYHYFCTTTGGEFLNFSPFTGGLRGVGSDGYYSLGLIDYRDVDNLGVKVTVDVGGIKVGMGVFVGIYPR